MPEPAFQRAVKFAAKRALERWIRLGVPRVRPRVVRRVPHDTGAFTQGLAWCDGLLYESTGGDTTSSVRAVDPATGEVQRLVPVDGDFAEGIAVLGEHLYQLAFVSGHARVYRLPTLERAGQRHYTGEGWGLAATPDGQLLASDGTSLLRRFDESFAVVGHLAVRSRGLPVRWLNDLECVGPRIYANIYAARDLAEIDARSGRVLRFVDCGELVREAAPAEEYAVLNGIAYNSQAGTFFLTGKHWPTLFEVEIPDN
ncbi:MAG: glutaminyl-peptide cyclotransferase [Pirellulales bacterium]